MIGMMEAMWTKLAEIVFAAGDNGIPIPGGENKTVWQLGTDPFTRHIGFFFFTVIIGVVSYGIWVKSDSIGPALSFFVVAHAVFAVVLPGEAMLYFGLFTVLGTVAIFMRALTR